MDDKGCEGSARLEFFVDEGCDELGSFLEIELEVFFCLSAYDSSIDFDI